MCASTSELQTPGDGGGVLLLSSGKGERARVRLFECGKIVHLYLNKRLHNGPDTWVCCLFGREFFFRSHRCTKERAEKVD